MRNGLLTLALICVLGAATLVAVAATKRDEVAFTVGLPAVRVAETAMPGGDLCRRDIDVAAAFSSVRLPVGTFGRSGPALAISVLDDRTGRLLGGGRIPAGYTDNSSVQTRVGTIPAELRIRVCVRDLGGDPVALLGSPPGTLAGKLADPSRRAEPAVVFLAAEPASTLARVPVALRRAATFKPGWVGPWTFWVLLAGMVVGLPLLLAAGIRAAYASERS